MRRFQRGNETYTPAQIRRAKPRLIYWVYFPQGIERRYKWRGYDVTELSNTMQAKTLKQALKLAHRYNAAYFERLVVCDLGRFALKMFARDHRPVEELWEEYKKLEPVRIGRKQ